MASKDRSDAHGAPSAGGRSAGPDARRETLFVGRAAELARFDALLAAHEGARLVAITGIGGIGKSSLLAAFRRRAEAAGVSWVHVDGRSLAPSPAGFEAAVGSPAAGAPCVLAIDSFEHLLPLEGWLREQYVPRLPTGTILILAGRWAPGAAWRADPGIAGMLVECALDALASADVTAYLERRGLPRTRRDAVARFARGHPLALALAADRVERDPGAAPFSSEAAPDLVHALAQWLLADVADESWRRTLEAAALVQRVTQPLLAAMLGTGDAREPFAWLAGQHFVELHAEGVVMHDLVRETIAAEVRWRDREHYKTLVHRACEHYLAGVEHGQPERLQAAIGSIFYTLRQEPHMRRHFQLDPGQHYLDSVQAGELPGLAAIVETFEGPEAAQRFQAWAEAAPARVAVVRDRAARPAGVALTLELDAEDLDAAHESPDPGVAAFAAHLSRRAPLRVDGRAMLMRFGLARDTFQAHGPVWSQIATYGNGLCLTPGLSVFAIAVDAELDWTGTAENADSPVLPETAFVSGGRRMMLMIHDMRSGPPLVWARNCIDRILGEAPPAGTDSPPPLLRRDGFGAAVLEALQQFHDDDTLRASPLRDACLVERRPAAPDTLRGLLERASREALDDGTARSPHRVLAAAYFDPAAPKRIAAAEALCMSERTFRRRLRRAEQALVEHLWQLESRWG